MKSEASDQRVGRTHNRRLRHFCSYTFFKKYVVFAAIVFAFIFLYCYIYNPNMTQLSNTNEPIHRGNDMCRFTKVGNWGQTPYDRLLHYILYPQTPCVTSIVLGGVAWENKRLDGDKVVCIEPGPSFGKECIVYSFGISNEWSFDEAAHKQFGCSVYAFDPSMGKEDHLHSESIWFYNLGIGKLNQEVKVNNQLWKMRTLDSILEQLGQRNKTIDLLKMDIEGAEWAVLDDLLNKGLLNHVNRLCVEIHLLSNPNWTQVLKLLKRIEAETGLLHFSTCNNSQVPLMAVPGIPGRLEQPCFEMAWYRR